MAQHITVVIPCISSDRSPKDTVISVFRQGEVVNEVICVTTANQLELIGVVEELILDWPEKKLILHKEDALNTAQARNKGLEIATNEWVAFIDPEDWLQPLRFETDLQVLSADITDVLVSSFQTVDKDFTILGQQRLKVSDDPWIKLMGSELGTVSSTLFRKSAIIAADSWSNEHGSLAVNDLLFRIMKSDGQVQIGEHSLSLRREIGKVSSEQERNTPWSKLIFDYLNTQNRYQQLFAKQGISNAEEALSKLAV